MQSAYYSSKAHQLNLKGSFLWCVSVHFTLLVASPVKPQDRVIIIT